MSEVGAVSGAVCGDYPHWLTWEAEGRWPVLITVLSFGVCSLKKMGGSISGKFTGGGGLMKHQNLKVC